MNQNPVEVRIAADLHIHSHFSDGTWSPEQIINELKRKKIAGCAITDHDTVDAFKTMDAWRSDKGTLEMLCGIECSTKDEPAEGLVDVHILGLGIDPQNQAVGRYCANIKKGRFIQKKKLVDKLNQDYGYAINLQDVLTQVKGGVIGRPHIIEHWLKNRALAPGQNHLERQLYYQRCAKYAIPTPGERSMPDIIKLIKEAGGVAILAHPGVYLDDQKVVQKAIKWGIDGLEVYYDYSYRVKNRHEQLQRQVVPSYLSIAQDNNLLISGGSDFHGSNREVSLGKQGVNRTQWEAIKTRIRQVNSTNRETYHL